MLGKITSLLILALLLSQGVTSGSGKAPLYEDQEAYEVYSAILPLEWPLKDAKAKNLIIQNETKGWEMCLRPDTEWQEKIGPAISDYLRLNAKPLLLQPRIKVEVPYRLIIADELKSVNHTAAWEGFYQRYPDSGGWMEWSAVGFNVNKTVAVVYGPSLWRALWWRRFSCPHEERWKMGCPRLEGIKLRMGVLSRLRLIRV